MDRRRPLEPGRELRGAGADAGPQLLQPPRDPDRPGAVAEVTLDLSGHVRDRKRSELHFPLRIEPVDGLDQADASHLDEILVLLAPHAVPSREALDQRHVLLDQALSCAQVSVLAVLADQAVHGLPAGACRRRSPRLGGLVARAHEARSGTPLPVYLCGNRSHVRSPRLPSVGGLARFWLATIARLFCVGKFEFLYPLVAFVVRCRSPGVSTDTRLGRAEKARDTCDRFVESWGREARGLALGCGGRSLRRRSSSQAVGRRTRCRQCSSTP